MENLGIDPSNSRILSKKFLENQKQNSINVVFAAKYTVAICLEYVGETLFIYQRMLVSESDYKLI